MHTLGPGSIIVETQQQSDTTYRLYDYGRPRELHLKEGLAAVKEKVASGKVIRPAPSVMRGGKNRQCAAGCGALFRGGYVRAQRRTRTFDTRGRAGKSSVQILVAVEGCGASRHPARSRSHWRRAMRWWFPLVVESFRCGRSGRWNFFERRCREKRCRSQKQECRCAFSSYVFQNPRISESVRIRG